MQEVEASRFMHSDLSSHVHASWCMFQPKEGRHTTPLAVTVDTVNSSQLLAVGCKVRIRCQSNNSQQQYSF
jgi:hypothetical protein